MSARQLMIAVLCSFRTPLDARCKKEPMSDIVPSERFVGSRRRTTILLCVHAPCFSSFSTSEGVSLPSVPVDLLAASIIGCRCFFVGTPCEANEGRSASVLTKGHAFQGSVS